MAYMSQDRKKELAPKIKKALKKMHPDAIEIHEVAHVAGWEVIENDGFEETISTYYFVGDNLVLLGTCVIEI